MARKIGCDDCGRVYAKKVDVPRQCQPYCGYVVKSPHTLGGYEWSGDEPPFDAD